MIVVYDIETYPNCFLACFKPLDGSGSIFEISPRRRHNDALYSYLQRVTRMIGFNNLSFDWPILDYFIRNPSCTEDELYLLAMTIIGAENRNASVIWDPIIPQVDLFRIHHFDNPAKSTSLKKLEFNMRSELVQDLPFPVGTCLNYAEMDQLMEYNVHDVLQTEKFWHLSQEQIALRMAINPEWINQSDTGLGRLYFERALAQAGVPLVKGGTPRPDGVVLADIMFPYLQFQTPALRDAVALLGRVHVTDIVTEDGKNKRRAILDGDVQESSENGEPIQFKKHTFRLGNVDVVMGLGGAHASMESVILQDCDILDLDVTSFYMSLAIANRIFPEHMGPTFCDVAAQLKAERLQYAKGTPENGMLKLSLNSVFGSSGSRYTNFYDLRYFLGTTINGQLLVLNLTEVLLLHVPGLQIVQINTDGVTVIVPPGQRPLVEQLYTGWAQSMCLELEASEYGRMWLRDVNNYIAEYARTGKRKRKGAYEHARQWHQNQSMPIIRRAAEAAMCDGVDVEDFICAHDEDGWDFLMRLDLSRQSYLALDDGTELRGVVRYYVSPTGHSAIKRMPETSQRMHARGHAEMLTTPAAWTCSACGEVFPTKTAWDAHKRGAHKGVKGVTVSGFKASHTCSACGEVFATKKAWEEHADAAHASRITIAQRYGGEPIDYDLRFYVNEARKLVLTR